MTKSSHAPDGDFTQNQNNSMSDDPADGGRKSFTAGGGTHGRAAGAPEEQDQETVGEFGRKGSGD